MRAEEQSTGFVGFTELIDLAAEKVGGRVLYANDEFFAEKENLLKPGRGVFIADKFTEHGKWMDGWETRRKRGPGYDFCILKLGLPGAVRGLNVDTNHFVGNFPEYCSVDGISLEDDPGPEALVRPELRWTELLGRSRLRGGSQNFFAVACEQRFTHLRLNIYPDGGVARFRVHGEVRPDLPRLRGEGLVDLAAAANGGTVVQCNDAFFGPKDNLILPGRALTMGEGWETRRKRVLPGFDWIVVRLCGLGTVQKVEVDTNHFKGNFPESCQLEGCVADPELLDFANAHHLAWKEILPRTQLRADHRHFFERELQPAGPVTHVRLKIFPDGGVSRLRVHGAVA